MTTAALSRDGHAARHTGGRYSYSRFVQLTKLMLATIALVLIAMVVIWPQLRPRDTGLPIGIAPSSREDAESLHMVNPRYTGLDENNLPYEVTADLASQETAAALQSRLRAAGVSSFTQKSGVRIRVRVGPFSKEEAEKVRAKLGCIGLSGTMVPL